mmetsp:Transcript_49319/g.86856  ORF Transcript_49319/g.86856 Transcript_49319/m.86856 type:complete len:299 (-) Transcript_49319:66-962(-)
MGTEGSPRLSDFGSTESFDAYAFGEALSGWLEPLRLISSPPFQVGWYNETRDATAGGVSRISAPDGAIAFAAYSVPQYLDVIVEHFARAKPESNFVDATTDEIIERLQAQLMPELDAYIANTDTGPPYYHVQTIGAVAGVDQHLEAADVMEDKEEDREWLNDLGDELQETRDPKMWGTDPATTRKVFGVNVHPTWGGWYGYRFLIVLRGVHVDRCSPELKRPSMLNFLDRDEAKRILSEYNLRHELCLWRDLSATAHPADRRYSPAEYFFFMEQSPLKRKRYLELQASHFAEPPKFRA